MDPEVDKEKLPVTTRQELENGIFSLVVALCQYYRQQGQSLIHSVDQVAGLLESFAAGLRAQTQPEEPA